MYPPPLNKNEKYSEVEITNIPQQVTVTVPNKHDQSVQTEASSDSWQSEVKDLNVLKYTTRVQQE